MEGDTARQDGYESDYPDPTDTERTPYPALTQSASRTSALLLSGGNGAPAVSTPHMADAAGGITSLVDYCNLRNARPNHVQRPELGGGDDAVDDTDAEQDIEGRDLMNQMLNRYTAIRQPSSSLPGYHILPENDRLNAGNTGQYPTVAQDQETASRGRGRGRPRSTGQGRGQRRGWKWALRGTEHANVFKTPRVPKDPTIKQRGRPGRSRGSRKEQDHRPVDPGQAFKELHRQAMKLYIEEDLEEALEVAKKAVEANSEMYQAHMLLYQILQKLGREEDSLAPLAMAAVTRRDAETWKMLAHRYLDPETRTDNDIRFAVYCYSQALIFDKGNYELRAEKLGLYYELGDWNKARKEAKNMMRVRPDDLDMLRDYANLCAETRDPFEWTRAVEAYAKAFQYFDGEETFGEVEGQWDHLNMYLDLLAKLGRNQEGVFLLKRHARWFLGRREDSFWDHYTEDDREYDSTNERRGYEWRFQQGRITRDNLLYGDGLPLDIRVKLGLFRMNMGITYHAEGFRHLEHLRSLADEVEHFYDLFFEVAESLRINGLWGAAIDFYEPIKTLLEVTNASFWSGIAHCYRELGRNEDAEECYRAVIEVEEENLDARVQLVKLYESTEQRGKAIAMAREVGRMGRRDILRKEKIRVADLAAKYAQQRPQREKKEEAIRKRTVPRPLSPTGGGIFDEFQLAIPSRSRPLLPAPEAPAVDDDPFEAGDDTDSSSDDSDDAGDGDNDDLEVETPQSNGKASKPPARSHKRKGTRGDDNLRALQEQEVRIRPHYERVKDLWPAIDKGEDEKATQEWMLHANALAEEFRSVKVFYSVRSRDRYLMKVRTGLAVRERGLIAEMEAVMQKLQEDGSKEEDFLSTDEGIPHGLHDVSFAEWHHILSELALLHAKHVDQAKCYYVLQDVIMGANVFRHDSVLMSTTLAMCTCCALMFNDSELLNDTARNYTTRRQAPSGMATQVFAASGRLGYGSAHLYSHNSQRWVQRMLQKQKESNGNDVCDPGLLTVYGHVMVPHTQVNADPALPYLLRALADQPENLVVNLSIATTYITNAMHKSTDNRQYGIAQGLAFLYRYYELRVASGKARHRQEAEYNVARMWHLLGLTHLAVPVYEKVLKLSDEVQLECGQGGNEEEETEDLAREAAFALQNIFALSGNDEAALAITEEWLVL